MPTEVLSSSVELMKQLDVPLFGSGKVRDTFDLRDGRLLMVTSDRISAFDVVLPQGVPGKGAVLTELSAFWFRRMKGLVSSHFIRLADGTKADGLSFALPPQLFGRTMIVKKARRIDIECVARGYLSGSGWADYKGTGMVCGIPLPKGLRESDKLPEPIFTPATKAASGHDENISFERMVDMVDLSVARQLRNLTLAIYRSAADYALERGIIIADTKFEFGWIDGVLGLIDEILTPDSSRFWPEESYQPGGPQVSFDKQPVRDWLIKSGWNREPPPPDLPIDVVGETTDRYLEIARRLTGVSLIV